MRRLSILAGIAMLAFGTPLNAQEVPTSPDQVAEPGGTLPGNPEIALVQVADGFHDPVNVTSAYDGSGRIFVVERVGRVKVVDQDGNVNDEPFLDLTQVNPLGNIVQHQFVEQGLYSIAFHPDFAENGHVFIHYASLPFNGDGMIARITVDPASPDAISPDRVNETMKIIMRIPQPYYNHNGGDIDVRPRRLSLHHVGRRRLGGRRPPGRPEDRHLLGKILRIDVDVPDDDGRAYRIPADNPFAEKVAEREMVLFGITEEGFAKIRPDAKPEIWAYGLRNPYKIAFDPQNDSLWIAEVGQNHIEEINWQPAGEGGVNYGWPINMGTHCHPSTGPDDVCPIVGTLPVAQYPHEEIYPGVPAEGPTGCSVQGFGVAHYGGMDGVFLAGDWCSGRVWGVGWDSASSAWVLDDLVQTDLQFTAGGRDEDGTILAVNCNCFYLADEGPEANPPGALWRVVPASEVPEGAVTARTVAN